MIPANPAFCKVLGHIQPLDPSAPPIKFEVNLPADWNGRSVQYGGGGFNGARMLGLTIVYDMKHEGLHYDDGMILDPRDGSMYHAMMDVSEDGKELAVRGYLMIKALGQTQVWHRLPDDSLKTADVPKEVLAGAEDPKVEAKANKKSAKNDPKTVQHEAKAAVPETSDDPK